MGDRAVIAFGKKPKDIGIYLHWNGGRSSVEAFLDAAKELDVRQGDKVYEAARLAQIIGNFFGGTTSLGVGTLDELDCDNYDNGVYVVNDKLEIVERLHHKGAEQGGKKNYEDVLAETLKKNKLIFGRKS